MLKSHHVAKERRGPNPPAGDDFLVCFDWVGDCDIVGGGVWPGGWRWLI